MTQYILGLKQYINIQNILFVCIKLYSLEPLKLAYDTFPWEKNTETNSSFVFHIIQPLRNSIQTIYSKYFFTSIIVAEKNGILPY